MRKLQRLLIVLDTLFRVLAAYLFGRSNEASMIVAGAFQRLGGIYVKFLQLLVLQPGFFEDWEAREKFDVFDNVASERLDIEPLLARVMSAKQRSDLAWVDPSVYAGGSFAQVYRAQLTDGTNVVMKVLRPTVREFLKFDQAALWVFSRLFHIFGGRFNIDFKAVYAEFKLVTSSETNYMREVHYASKMYERYKGHQSLVIPKTYTHLSSRHLLVQEHIDGLPLSDVLRHQQTGGNARQFIEDAVGSDMIAQFRELGYDMLYQNLMGYESQGDPHPGNIFLLPENKVALVDFGIIGTPPVYRHEFYELVQQYDNFYKHGFDPGEFFKKSLQFYSNNLYRALVYADTVNGPDNSLLTSMARSVNAVYESKKTNPVVQGYIRRAELRSVFIHTINPGNRYGIGLEFDAGIMLKASSTFVSVISELSCKEQVMSHVYDAVTSQVARAGMPDQPAKPITPELSAETISAWLQRIANNDPLLYASITNRQKEGLRV